MNIAQQYAAVMDVRRGQYTFDEDDRDPYARVFRLLSEADAIINERLMVVIGTHDQTLSLSPTAWLYPRPARVINNLITRQELIWDNGDEPTVLDRESEDAAKDLFGNFLNTTGANNAFKWWMSSTDYKMGVGYPPQKAGILRTSFVTNPSEIESDAISVNRVITASVDHDDVVVTFSGSLPAYSVRVGDQIGFGDPPGSFYWIDAPTPDDGSPITGVVLSSQDKFRRKDVTGSPFVISRISDVQKFNSLSKRSGMLGVLYTLAHLLQATDPGRSAKYLDQFYAGLGGGVPSDIGVHIPKATVSRNVPWMGGGSPL